MFQNAGVPAERCHTIAPQPGEGSPREPAWRKLPKRSHSILTGFPAAGNTTVLNRLVRHAQMATALVIINELGEFGLDHELVERAIDDMVLLQSACLCCTSGVISSKPIALTACCGEARGDLLVQCEVEMAMPAAKQSVRRKSNVKSKAGARSKPNAKARGKQSARTGQSGRKWSAAVNQSSDALDLKENIFKSNSPAVIAQSLKRSAEQSRRRKSSPYRSAMSMLTFYINRGGKNLSATRKRKLEAAKGELRRAFGKEG